MVIDFGPSTPLRVAANNCFWDMSRTNVQKFAELGEVFINGASSLFETLFQAVKGLLNCTDEEAMPIMGKRLADQNVSQAFADEMRGLDVAMDLFEPQDRDALKSDIKVAEAKEESIADFKVELASQRQTMEKKKKQKLASQRPKVPHIYTQVEAAVWAPAGCSVWLGTTRPEWWGHCPGYRRVWQPYLPGGSLRHAD